MTTVLSSVLTLIGGLSFFMFGMNLMSGSLEKMAGGKLELTLKKMTANPLISLFLGAVITIAMQSSSATTVMLVGLANSGILEFAQTLAVSFGANVGTTLTGWITSLIGLETDNIFLMMLKPSNFSPVLALVGVVLMMFSKKNFHRSVATVFLGFAVLMFGMTLMSDAVKPLREIQEFQTFLGSLRNPFLALFVSFAFTAVIQSSAATLGILQALAIGSVGVGDPTMTVSVVIPMVMGLNIGTCATSLISAIGTGTNAKRVAFSHLMLNILGAAICMPIYLVGLWVFDWAILKEAATGANIALLHTLFNIVITVTLMPFSKLLVKLVEFIIREKKTKEEIERDNFCVVDERLMQSPSIAIAECGNLTVQMNDLAFDTLKTSISVLYNYDAEVEKQMLFQEDRLDLMEDRMGTYLVRLSSRSLSQADSRQVSKMLHTIGDFERLGDHAVNLLKASKEMHDKQISFSEEAKKELSVLTEATLEIMELTSHAFHENSAELAAQVEPLEQVIDKLIATIKAHHIDRLRAGGCTIELGFILSDLLNNYRRVSDHCSNIAVAIIEVAHDSFDTHRYLNDVKYGNSEFNHAYEAFEKKYEV